MLEVNDLTVTYGKHVALDAVSIEVKAGERVTTGQRIGTVGDAGGVPHLHIEVRDIVNMDIGFGYGSNTKGYVRPTEWLKARLCED